MRKLRLVLVQCLLAVTSQTVVVPCESQVYCHGELLDTVQKLDMFEESKYFVDMGLRVPESDVIESFNQLTVEQKTNSSFMFDWVNVNFAEPGFEFDDVEFTIENDPQFLSRINDSTYRNWAHQLYKIWPQLGRGVKPIVAQQPDRTSFLPLKHQTVVPTGHDGRFRESYYWDTFWTLRGMLQCGLVNDVYEILLNFRDLIRQYGFVPNGTRKYYTKRSQPPFYIMMVSDLINHQPDETKRLDMTREFIDSMMDEFDWWEKNRAVQVRQHTLHRYASDVDTNRPEAYLPDEHVLSQLDHDPAARAQLAAHITSAAESGWDFSYRWTGERDIDNDDVLVGLRTRDIIPVDLNFILAHNAKALADFTSLLSTGADDDVYSDKSEIYKATFKRQMSAIEAVLYNDTDKSYFDYDLRRERQNTQFFASNYVPLFTHVWPKDINANQRQLDLLASLQRHDVASYQAGIPNSLKNTGQQWDYPNAWPPSTHMIVMGLFESGLAEAQKYAQTIASKWLSANYALFEGTVAWWTWKINLTWLITWPNVWKDKRRNGHVRRRWRVHCANWIWLD